MRKCSGLLYPSHSNFPFVHRPQIGLASSDDCKDEGLEQRSTLRTAFYFPPPASMAS
jgi:hypothetical protein